MGKKMIHLGVPTLLNVDATATVKTFTLLIAVKRTPSARDGLSSTVLIKRKQRLIFNIMFYLDQRWCNTESPGCFN